MIDLAEIKPDIEKLWKTLPVRRLDLFGSLLTETHTPDSDADVLVAFGSDENIDYFTNYFELKEGLQGILHREIDLVIDKPFKNPVLKNTIEKTRTKIYER
jgi:uncharacterized protein